MILVLHALFHGTCFFFSHTCFTLDVREKTHEIECGVRIWLSWPLWSTWWYFVTWLGVEKLEVDITLVNMCLVDCRKEIKAFQKGQKLVPKRVSNSEG